MASIFPSTQANPQLNSGYGTPSNPAQGIKSDYIFRDPANYGGTKVLLGRVVDSFPEKNVCLVMAGFEGFIKCTYHSGLQSNVSGLTDITSPGVGDTVIVAKTHDTNYGWIISGALNQATVAEGSKPTFPLWAPYQGTYHEIRKSKTFNCSPELDLECENVNAANDFIPGENIKATEHHVAFLITKLLLRLQGSGLCSINLHSTDDLMDVVAHNFNFFNSAFRIRSLTDYGNSNTQILTTPALIGYVDDQYKNHTISLNSGYFAGGVDISCNGKFEEGKRLSETYYDELGIISQKTNVSCWMQKLNGIYTPIKLKEQDTPHDDGDKFIQSELHKEPFQIASPEDHPGSFGCKSRDYVAWQSAGGYRFKRFENYKKDWAPPDIKSGSDPKMGNGQYCQFGKIKYAKSEVENGLGEVQVPYREGESFCGILPDGSIVLREAGGASIELRSGKIIITAPKDIDIFSGQNTNIIASNDVIIKSKEAIDINSTNKQIRMSSGTDTLINATSGSIQITALQATRGPNIGESCDDPKGVESRKYKVPGIVLKTNSTILNNAPYINEVAKYLYSVMGEAEEEGTPGTNCPSKHPFIFLRSSSALHWADGSEMFHTTRREEKSQRERTVIISEGSVQGGQYAVFEKTVYSKEYLFCEKSLVAVQHCLINGLFVHDSPDPHVKGPYKRPPDGNGPIQVPATEAERYRSFGEAAEFPKVELTRRVRSPWKEGFYDLISFRYRDYRDYKTQGHLWFESFWQRQYKDTLGSWYSESPTQNMDTDITGETVYPGKRIMNEDSYVEYEEKNVTKDGTPIPASQQSHTGGSFSKKTYIDMPVPNN
jgi:hypothetical protein